MSRHAARCRRAPWIVTYKHSSAAVPLGADVPIFGPAFKRDARQQRQRDFGPFDRSLIDCLLAPSALTVALRQLAPDIYF